MTTTDGTEGPHKIVIIADNGLKAIQEAYEYTHWEKARFIHVKPNRPLSNEEMDDFAQGFNNAYSDRVDRPIILVGDHFDVEVYVLKVDTDES